jgi:OOP family OmpA-OmpF porin
VIQPPDGSPRTRAAEARSDKLERVRAEPLSIRRLTGVVAAVLALAAGARTARADDDSLESRLHASLGLGHAVGDPLSSELGVGGQLGVAYELRFAHVVGLELGVNALALAQGTVPPGASALGTGFDVVAGGRFRPIAAGPWLELGVGAASFASDAHAAVEARLGWDVVSVWKPELSFAPFVGYTQIVLPSDAPSDARFLWVGVSIDLGFHPDPARGPDRDKDGVTDEVDACPSTPGVSATSAWTNGCPPPRIDLDADGVPDDVDACLYQPGGRSGERDKNGCFIGTPDRDHDGVPDAEDVCPDIGGDHTYDTRTNGCPTPPDRDRDGILNADDACPDVPGPHSEDPRKNGCPPATAQVHLEGDEIMLDEVLYFETGSPHIHHVSWPIVQKIAQFINATPDIESVDIEGHADEIGDAKLNQSLSSDRAVAVKRLLVHFGVDEKKLATHAYGAEHPIEYGHDKGARAKNRAVIFTVTHAKQGDAPAPALPEPPRIKPKD